MKVLVVGSGGREHALCASLRRSPLLTTLFCAPGSGGIAGVAQCVAIGVDDLEGMCRFATAEEIDLVVVGPERPLVEGLVDRLEAAGVRAFGPRAAAARLEGSKAFMKSFARRHGIPTAACRVFDAARRHEAEAHVRNHPLPVVVKADGLAAGKGVVVAEDTASALAALDAAFEGRLGDAGACVVVEEFLEGEEASLFALCDGIHAIGIGTAQDHKRAFDGDRGPNTGGMGAYSPAPILGGAMTERVMREIVRPTLAGMAAEGTPFSGFLYAGLMIGADGPRLVEFNVRFGDPECQTVLPRLKSDLLGLLTAATRGVLDTQEVAFADDHALTVVAATRGYPGAYEKGSVVGGLPDVLDDPDVMIFHAGTRRDGDLWRAEGGRVFAVTGLGGSLAVARAKAYAALARICWPEGYYRSDIGWRALRRT